MSDQDRILEKRANRENLVRKICSEYINSSVEKEKEIYLNRNPDFSFEYFPTNKNLIVEGEFTPRKVKPGPEDYSILYDKIGMIEFQIDSVPYKSNLFKLRETEDLFFTTKDYTTESKQTYTMGRFVQVINEGDSYIIDFNLSFSPICYYIHVPCPFIRDEISFEITAGQKYNKPWFDSWSEPIKKLRKET